MQLLIVEDDRKSALALEAGLQSEGFSVTLAGTGEEGFFLLGTDSFDLVLLDWMLPGRDGLEILKAARARGTKTPILLMSARDAIADRVLGLDSGADDYLVKPFAFGELVARVRNLLRRAPIGQSVRRRIADLSVDFQTRTVARGGQRIDLTPREFDVLACLMRYPGDVVTRQILLRDVWRETQRQTPLYNVIDVHVTHLRRKVDGGRPTTLIQTVHGVGFILREERRSET
jgi:two-component system copper resistance phosphate regulon response regulator CusR